MLGFGFIEVRTFTARKAWRQAPYVALSANACRARNRMGFNNSRADGPPSGCALYAAPRGDAPSSSARIGKTKE